MISDVNDVIAGWIGKDGSGWMDGRWMGGWMAGWMGG
jgi:hypothetical protein